MNCNHCGAQVSEEHSYCLGCGQPVQEDSRPPPGTDDSVEGYAEPKVVGQQLMPATLARILKAATRISVLSFIVVALIAGFAGALVNSAIFEREGPQGIQGPRGEQGIQGEAGSQGPQGDRGPIGLRGTAGPAGQATIVTPRPAFTSGDATQLTQNQVRSRTFPTATNWIRCASAEYRAGNGQWVVTCDYFENEDDLVPKRSLTYQFDDRTGQVQ